MKKIYKPLHVGISVYDIDEAIKWYEKNLDFELVKDFYVPMLKARIAFIRNGNFEIELFEYDEPKPIPQERLIPDMDLQTVGTKHIALEVDDMKSVKEKFLENNVDIVHEVIMEGDLVMFIRDNSGVLIEIIQKKQ